ncbi:MAG TPA: Holliday junction resolvase RuvX [Acidimicrobiia bacterium]|nr:Holliday junction resolvase RuvX [Acidimicrobiia bacterium]
MGFVTATAGTRVLGVDLGERRIGLALSDPSRSIASPHAVIRRGPDRDADRREIVEAARAAGADVIVVGLPLSLSGREGPAARAAIAEVDELRALAVGIEVTVYDERLTTVTAERVLDEAGVRRDARRAVVDKIAAAVMLQAWLDRTRS